MQPFAIVIFGVTSNLAQKKLIPALYDLFSNCFVDSKCKIIGVARQNRTRDEMEKFINETLCDKGNQEAIKKFSKRFDFVFGDVKEQRLYDEIKEKIEKEHLKNKIFYFATYPEFYEGILKGLKLKGLSDETEGFSRLMIEKPIGNNLRTAKNLNKLLDKYFSENQIFRIDHYLGKETVQNMLTFRFKNELFNQYLVGSKVDHIQITSAEDFGVEMRSGYYDSVGALRDVGQNHILQLLAFATMGEKKNVYLKEAISLWRLSLLNTLQSIPKSLVLGQYKNYSENKVSTDTFFAFKTVVNVGPMRGVPVYVRGGKKLKRTVTEVVFMLKNDEDDFNQLIFRIQPNEGIIMKVFVKKPGDTLEVNQTEMEFCFKNYTTKLKNPYEKLILDAIKGEKIFFSSGKEVEAQWKFIDSLKASNKKIEEYEEGGWGPKSSDEMIENDGRKWIEPNESYCRI